MSAFLPAPPLNLLTPMLAGGGAEPFGDTAWAYELHVGGHRMLADLGAHGCRLRSAGGVDITARFAEVARALAGVGRQRGGRTIVDGVLSVLDGGGRNDAAMLLERSLQRPGEPPCAPVVYSVFDVLVDRGLSLLQDPWTARRRLLDGLPLAGEAALRRRHPVGNGVWLLRQAVALGLTGIVAKRRDSSYVGGPSGGRWRLVRCP